MSWKVESEKSGEEGKKVEGTTEFPSGALAAVTAPFIQNEEHVRTKRGHVGRMEIMESMARGVDFGGWGCCGMSGQHPTSISSAPKIPSQVEFILSHN